LQGDNIRARIAPRDTGAYRRTVGLHYLGCVSPGEHLLGSDHQIVRHRVPLNGGDRGARIATTELCGDAVADASAAESCSRIFAVTGHNRFPPS
jgi:hypothetical protein